MTTAIESERPIKVSRRLHLGDAMILLAALSLTLLLLLSVDYFNGLPTAAQRCCNGILELGRLKPWSFPTLSRGEVLKLVLVTLADQISAVVFSILISLVPALLVIRFLQPRPALRSVIRQPGFGVCVTLLLGLLVVVDLRYLGLLSSNPFIPVLGLSPLLLWIITGLPPWKPEPSWIDRTGRVAGFAWITASILDLMLVQFS
jgi:hypothetical protein